MPGRKGTPQAQVHKVFSDRIKSLRDSAKRLSSAYRGKSQRSWAVPDSLETSTLDVANLHVPAFDREPINAEYMDATKDVATAGTTGDVIALQLQIAYNAAEERAFRARHATLCRSFALGHGRRFGQGHGNVWDPARGVEARIAALIAAGGTKDGT